MMEAISKYSVRLDCVLLPESFIKRSVTHDEVSEDKICVSMYLTLYLMMSRSEKMSLPAETVELYVPYFLSCF